ncbi:MAG: phage tail tube protein [Candidatus Thiodiazotropha endolucinida]
MKWREMLIMLKPEPVYGQDSAPVVGTDAVQASNIELMPLEADLISRGLLGGTLGNELQMHVGVHMKLSFDVEMAGSGTAGTVSQNSAPLRGCSHGEQINVDNVLYSPIDQNEEANTAYLHFSGQLHAMTGSRGSVGIRLNPKGVPVYHYEYIGLWAGPSSVADPDADFSGLPDPLSVSNTNTPTFTLFGAAQKVAAFEFKQNNGTFYDNLIGAEEVPVNDRKPSASITIEAPEISVMDWFTTAKNGVTGALQWIHGLTAGHITEFNAPRVQPLRPRYVDRNGKAMIQMDLSLIAPSGAPEYTITER